ncbi:MAG: hypothetical protein WBX25_22175 [Rhodomicrobium sp.]
MRPCAVGGEPNYPVAPRYPKVLAMLGANAPQISTKPTHVLLAETEVFETAARFVIEKGS